MAKLYPLDCQVVNNHGVGEAKIIELIKQLDNEKTEDWIILYSYMFKYRNLNDARNAKDCEIDFLCLLPNIGIFVFEIKGGKISKEYDNYYSTDRLGIDHEIHNPYKQARQNYYDLNTRLGSFVCNGKYQTLGDFRGGYLVGFPDMTQLLFDDILGGRQNTFLDGDNLYDFFEKAGRTESNSIKLIPTKKDIDQIYSALQGKNYTYKYSINDYLDTINVKLNQLTEEQKTVMEGLLQNKRCLVKGGAGTGKTVLCEFIFINEMNKKERVAYFSFNELNAIKVRNDTKRDNTSVCMPLYAYLEMEYERLYNEKCTLSWDEGKKEFLAEKIYEKSDDDRFTRFSTIIIDEAQDLGDSKNLFTLLDEMLIGGFKNGRCYIFYDEYQNIFNYDKEKPIYENEYFKDGEKGYRYTKFELHKNCRNADEIKDKIQSIRDNKKVIEEESKVFKNELFNDSTRLVNKIIEDIELKINERIDQNRITILYNKRECYSSIIEKIKEKYPNIKEYTVDDRKTISFSTCQRFKGLENDVIFYIRNKKRNAYDKYDYVAISRARSICYVYSLIEN